MPHRQQTGSPPAPPQVVVPEVMPPEPPRLDHNGSTERPLPKWLSRRRLILAFIIAVISDVLSVWVQLVPPAQWTVDFLTAAALFAVLGWRWPLLVGLFLEAIPGVAVFPAWVLVVGAIAALGSPRPGWR